MVFWISLHHLLKYTLYFVVRWCRLNFFWRYHEWSTWRSGQQKWDTTRGREKENWETRGRTSEQSNLCLVWRAIMSCDVMWWINTFILFLGTHELCAMYTNERMNKQFIQKKVQPQHRWSNQKKIVTSSMHDDTSNFLSCNKYIF